MHKIEISNSFAVIVLPFLLLSQQNSGMMQKLERLPSSPIVGGTKWQLPPACPELVQERQAHSEKYDKYQLNIMSM